MNIKQTFQALFLIVSLGLPTMLLAEASSSEQAATAEQLVQVNINTASVEEMSAGLKGIGMKRAFMIKQFREKNGKFFSPEELQEVRGIGNMIMEMNKGLIKVEE